MELSEDNVSIGYLPFTSPFLAVPDVAGNNIQVESHWGKVWVWFFKVVLLHEATNCLQLIAATSSLQVEFTAPSPSERGGLLTPRGEDATSRVPFSPR